MKVLANDGISKSGIKALEKGGFEVITTKVAQEQVANFINTHDVKVILVRSATKVRKDIIDACPGLKIIGRGGVGMVVFLLVGVSSGNQRDRRIRCQRMGECADHPCHRR